MRPPVMTVAVLMVVEVRVVVAAVAVVVMPAAAARPAVLRMLMVEMRFQSTPRYWSLACCK